jgi:two-component system, NtrC family, response regulator AtoC
VRIIAATNRLPYEAVAAGKLREDLLYRLNVFPIELPPLRERLSDVGLLARHFLAGISEQEGQVRRFTPAALAQLAAYPWPGNVRELRNAVQRAYVMAQGELIDDCWLPRTRLRDGATGSFDSTTSAGALDALQPQGQPAAPVTAPNPQTPPSNAAGPVESIVLPIGTSMAQAEKALMLATLRHFNHHKERTAAVLGISLKTLYNRLKEYAAEEASRRGDPEP